MNDHEREVMERLIAGQAEIKAELVAISLRQEHDGQFFRLELAEANKNLGRINGSIADHFKTDQEWMRNHEGVHREREQAKEVEARLRREIADGRRQRIAAAKEVLGSLRALVLAAVTSAAVGAAVVKVVLG